MTLTIHDETGRAWTFPLPERIARDLEAYRALQNLKSATSMIENARDVLLPLLSGSGAVAFDDMIDSAHAIVRTIEARYEE